MATHVAVHDMVDATSDHHLSSTRHCLLKICCCVSLVAELVKDLMLSLL